MKIYRGKLIHNYNDDKDALLIHVDRTKPIWLFLNLWKKEGTLEQLTRQEAATFLKQKRIK